MTKVKDLIDVIVDTVFISFPVDSERYELIDQLVEVSLWDLSDERYPMANVDYQLGGNVHRFFEETSKTFRRHADAVTVVNLGAIVSPVVWDRYHRTVCALTRYHFGSSGFDPSVVKHKGDVYVNLWFALADRLQEGRLQDLRVSK